MPKLRMIQPEEYETPEIEQTHPRKELWSEYEGYVKQIQENRHAAIEFEDDYMNLPDDIDRVSFGQRIKRNLLHAAQRLGVVLKLSRLNGFTIYASVDDDAEIDTEE